MSKTSETEWPLLVSEATFTACKDEYSTKSNQENMTEHPCGVCAKLTKHCDLVKEDDSNINFDVDNDTFTFGHKRCSLDVLMANEDESILLTESLRIYEHQTKNYLSPNIAYLFQTYFLEPRAIFGEPRQFKLRMCRGCIQSLKLKKGTALPKHSLKNGHWIGEVPDELMNLTYAERLCISIYRPVLKVIKIRLKGNQQRAMTGNACYFINPVEEIIEKLPLALDNLQGFLRISVTRTLSTTNTPEFKALFNVCRIKIKNAMKWLIKFNKNYEGLPIDEENLNTLPLDAIPENIFVVDEILDYVPNVQPTNLTEGLDNLTFSGMMGSVNIIPTAQTTQAAIQNFMHISVNKFVNVFGVENLLSKSYPHLYSFGMGDPTSKKPKLVKVGLEAHIRHNMQYADHRFSREHSYLFAALHLINKLKVYGAARFRFKQEYQEDISAMIAKLTGERITSYLTHLQSKTKINQKDQDNYSDVKALIDRFTVLTEPIKGSNASKMVMRKKIRSLLFQ